MNINKNKGMYIEELMNNTAMYYDENRICYIEKRFLPIIPLSITNNIVKGKLIKKSSVDYCCVYKGKYIDIELKQTDEDEFDIRKIKNHQLNHLEKINYYKGKAYLMIYFFKRDVIYMIEYNDLSNLINNNIFKIKCFDKSIEKHMVEIKFPGIIDLVSVFELNS